MRLLKTVAALRCFVEMARTGLGPIDGDDRTQPGQPMSTKAHQPITIGLVPTMGALHAGHASLLAKARAENTIVILTIFVNPLQFGPGEDFDRYPRHLAADLVTAKAAGVDAVFAPTAAELGLDRELVQVVPPAGLMAGLCGRSRPGHFTGVATIVTKLLNLVQADRAYFGQKDAQQVAIVRRLTQDLNVPTAIVVCPIVREADGLALSSRNAYLSPAERSQALALNQALQAAQARFRQGERSAAILQDTARSVLTSAPDLVVDYVELVDPASLDPLTIVETSGLLAVAAHLGPTRLIDNCLLHQRDPIVAIDGPAGAGKSTVTRRVARELGLLFLDTGAMYRSIAWLALDRGCDPGDRLALAELVASSHIDFEAADLTETTADTPSEQSVWLTFDDDRYNVTAAIRTAAVTAQVSTVAAHPEVRRALVAQQQRLGQRGGLVAEGRDIGTTVFPDAEVKIFLTATPAERARRRAQDLAQRGQPVPDLDQLTQEISDRDLQDSSRTVSPLKKADDAWELVSDGLTIDQVVQAILERYRAIVGDQGHHE